MKKQKLDLEQWQKLYYQNQQSYLRARLLAIKFLAEGKTRTEVSELVNCTYKTLTSWIDQYLEGGLEKLTESIKHQDLSKYTFFKINSCLLLIMNYDYIIIVPSSE